MNNYNIATNTKHIADGDVLFCFLSAEKYLSNDVLQKSSVIYVVEGFYKRLDDGKLPVNGDVVKQADITKKIIEIPENEIYNFLVKQLQDRYILPNYLSAITGTKGKTSTCWFAMQMLNLCGKKCGYIGTIGAYYTNGTVVDENRSSGTSIWHKMEKDDTLTTPFVDEMYRFLNQMYELGVEYVVFEASRHALEQQRLAGLHINVSGFTNLSQDHLDYHGNMHNYLSAKEKLFTDCQKGGDVAIINMDDDVANNVIDCCNNNNLSIETFGFSKDAKCKIISIENDNVNKQQIVKFEKNCKMYSFKTNILGSFQVKNLILALLVAEKNGCDIEYLCQQMPFIKAPKGRMEKVDEKYNIFVDYAHSPTSLEESLLLLRGIYKKVAVVFGCGGDRDKKKRPIMFEIAKLLCDEVFLTNDNPKTENPDKIIDDILCFEKGTDNDLKDDEFVKDEIDNIRKKFSKNNIKCEIVVNTNREKAIEQSIDWYFSHLQSDIKDDVCVLIAGKGHEDYQILGNEKIHFDDCKMVEKFIQKYNNF